MDKFEPKNKINIPCVIDENKIMGGEGSNCMAKYSVYGKVTGTKYVGEFEANSAEEAIQMAEESDNIYIFLCWQCAKEIDDPMIEEFIAEKNKE
jgi:hypothetical protein